jgi:hypothetical protein
MRYASIIRAELGWRVVLVDSDGNPHIHDVRKWGVRFEDGKLIPLDTQDESMYRPNFVMLLNPNEETPPMKEIARKAHEKWAERSLEKSST